ncbi:S1 RNA-binding domain-containing protein [Candidatus Woesearchaeota archaeon]|nr:S1 RNA-binding domain-containing protein [Candidatus Woesearchaeota archaeon]
MLYKKIGYPPEEEIVLCKVTKLLPNSVFVDLLEYEQRSGLVHISEVAPGRIRNLRDYVSQDRQIVCKVLKVYKDRGHIDLSLRRVNSTERRQKLDEIKQELKAEQLLVNIAKKLKRSAEEIYKEISPKILKDYAYIHLCFRDIVSGEVTLESLGIKKQLADEITEAVIDKFKPKTIILTGEIRLSTFATAGVEKIKQTLHSIEKISDTISLSYLGAGRYKLTIEDFDYKPAEQTLKKIQDLVEKFIDKVSTGSVEREKAEQT